ncbi:hypothetical protein DM01DRAFT_1377929 [Hesseltinella vesiculosa]|uniref:Secreted protein n=1 Tax=Hesseltinella vesiculosa TaxID=101127 RepID=A0A1X2G748_9FUNG|nr:hypothetical protein DM01DRAFT_1377929 [Hesseltinella vesiculosa]
MRLNSVVVIGLSLFLVKVHADLDDYFPYFTNDYTDYISDGDDYAQYFKALSPGFPAYIPPGYRFHNTYMPRPYYSSMPPPGSNPGAYNPDYFHPNFASADMSTTVEPPIAHGGSPASKNGGSGLLGPLNKLLQS